MFQLTVFFESWCDVVLGLVVTGAGVVAGAVVTGGAVADEDELEAAPPLAAPTPVLADGDGDALVVLVAAVVDVELVEVVLLTLAASNGSRVWLVGVVRCPEAAWEWWVAGADVVVVAPAAGGAAMSALALWPCNTNGTATMAAMITTASGQRRRSKRSRFRDFILWPPLSQPSVGRWLP